MFDLVTDKFRGILKKEYHRRLHIAVLVLTILTLTIFCILMATIYYESFVHRQTIEAQYNQVKSDRTQQSDQNFINTVQNIKGEMILMNDFPSDPMGRDLVQKVIAQKGNKVILSGFSLSFGAKDNQLSIQGTSVTREDLLSFYKRLQNMNIFSKVDLPLSTYTKDNDLSFNISLTYPNQ